MKNELAHRLSKWNLGDTFGVPHTFTPNLSIFEAAVAALVAFTRIFLGSVNFSLWGVAAWMTYAAISNPVLRVIAVLPIILLFVITTAALMLGITTAVNWAHGRKHDSI
jgi:hypothetical protein